MNRTKTIYFLSAIVLIIGCYALNLSYSLFVQTENRDVVNLTVPSLAYSLETSTYTIPANSGKLIKLKVVNSGTTDINYGISTTQVDGLIVQLVEKTDNNITGTLAASEAAGEPTSKEVLVYVTNSNEIDTNITFNISAKYTTLKFNENFETTSNIDIVNLYKIKYLNETLIVSAQDAVTNNDATRTLYNDTFDLNNITGVSAETDRMLALAEDDYGTSYVYRGAVKDNFVKFAGFTWRIVRVNGDGTVRLILEGTLDKVKREGVDNYAGTTSAFNTSPYNDNAYVGYMYGLEGITTNANRCLILEDGSVIDKVSDYTTQELCEQNGGKWTTTAYEATHANVGSSSIKINLDNFYENYIENAKNTYHYEKYLSDSIFCADKNLANYENDTNTKLGYGMGINSRSHYAATERLFYNDDLSIKTIINPKLKCLAESKNNSSIYTKSVQEINGVTTNGDLKYPIGLLTADEAIMAGAFNSNSSHNESYYLYDSCKKGLNICYWWTLTPNLYTADSSGRGYASVIYVGTVNNIHRIHGNTYVSSAQGVRPVINLKKGVIINAAGDGTENSPYIVLDVDDSK